MADGIRKVDYFKALVQDKAGEGARILSALRGEGINLLFFTGFPRGRKSQLDFIPENGAAFRKAAKMAGLAVTRKTAFLVQGQDRPGVIAGIVSKLAEAGVNITALYAIAAGEGRYGAIVWVKPAEIRKAAKALGAT
ncbi:MAG: ACT domain-containing protein [Candidatus Deferrimicrobiaceae bacterium]